MVTETNPNEHCPRKYLHVTMFGYMFFWVGDCNRRSYHYGILQLRTFSVSSYFRYFGYFVPVWSVRTCFGQFVFVYAIYHCFENVYVSILFFI